MVFGQLNSENRKSPDLPTLRKVGKSNSTKLYRTLQYGSSTIYTENLLDNQRRGGFEPPRR